MSEPKYIETALRLVEAMQRKQVQFASISRMTLYSLMGYPYSGVHKVKLDEALSNASHALIGTDDDCILISIAWLTRLVSMEALSKHDINNKDDLEWSDIMHKANKRV